MTPPTAPERCPTCDREGCRRSALGAEFVADFSAGAEWSVALADCARNRKDWHAEAIANRTAAARWAKVAPLIERLRAECGEPPFRGRVPSLIECAAAILAATEATP